MARLRRLDMAMLIVGSQIAACSERITPPEASVNSPPQEQIVDLVGLGGYWAVAQGINSVGRVVGEADVGGARSHAFSWSALGGIRDLGTLGGASSGAAAINYLSQIVGWSTTIDGVSRAFLMTAGDKALRDLGTPPRGIASAARAISDAGKVVGVWVTEAGETRAFAWTEQGGMRDLPPLSDLRDAEATGVNRSGQVVGSGRSIVTGELRAMTWSPTGEAGSLGPLVSGVETIAVAINGDGQVVGTRRSGSNPARAFRWSAETGMRDLGVLAGMDWSVARAISDKGHVVGYSGRNGSDVGAAFLWTDADGMRALGTMAASDRTESAAFAVNWNGRAVGYSWNGTSFRPVVFPEPR